MTSPAESTRRPAYRMFSTSRPPRSWRIVRGRARRWTGENGVVLLVGLMALAAFVLIVRMPTYVPPSVMSVPLVVASFLLGPRVLPWFVVFLLGLMVVAIVLRSADVLPATAVSVGAIFLVGLLILLISFRRSRLGVAGLRGESMFVDLRDRILGQGGIPALPPGWQVQSAIASAGGTLFAGDFVVAARPAPERLEVVVVDVSGKGEQAGTRALLLSGAFGGLLGALPPEDFLDAANDYLLRQDWDEGFATAVHLSVDLATGAFQLRTAGHPPAIRRAAGSGRWQVLDSEGPVLGLIPGAEFSAARGVLEHGDAVLLYTDGMVELPHRDIELGIDRLAGEAESLLRGDPREVADRLVRALGSRNDDRATVVVHRL